MKPRWLSFRNFKSVGDTTQSVSLQPITLLFGPNSAGKSTVLQAIIYLREVLSRRNYNPDFTSSGGDWLNLGGFMNLVNLHDSDRNIEISLEFNLDESDAIPVFISDRELDDINEFLESEGLPVVEDLLGRIQSFEVGVTLQWSDVLNAPLISECKIRINKDLFAKIVSTSDAKQIYIDSLNIWHPVLSEIDDDTEGFSEFISQYLTSGHDNLPKNRPFTELSLDDLESLVLSAGDLGFDEVAQLKLELSTRSSRRASKLLDTLSFSENIQDVSSDPFYIGVLGQKDALPVYERNLNFPDEVWLGGDSELIQEFDNYVFEKVADVGELHDIDLLWRMVSETVISSMITGPIQMVRDWLEDSVYIGPLRELPPRNYTPPLTSDPSRWSEGLGAWDSLYSATQSKIDEVNFWLGERCLKTGYQVSVSSYRELPVDSPVLTLLDGDFDIDDQLLLKSFIEELPVNTRVQLIEDGSGLMVMPQDVGVGISQVLPVVVIAVLKKTGLISIEQPELHVHPAIQVELADLFARYALKDNKLFLLETHSEHVMLRLLRRIRESSNASEPTDIALRKTDVSVVYVESTPEGTVFSHKRVNDSGDFDDEWPNGFFEERDEELFF